MGLISPTTRVPPGRPAPRTVPGKPLTWLLAVVVFFVAGWIVRKTLGHASDVPAIASDLLTRPWVTEQIGRSGVEVETPWHLEGFHMPLPQGIKVTQWTWIRREKDGFNVMAGRVVFAAGSRLSLEGAADGMIQNVKAVPGTRSTAPRKWDTTLLGRPAIEVEIRIQREQGTSALMHGIIVLRGLEMIQLGSIARADQPLADQAWERIRNSVRARS
jgi:hypothetical protein